MKKLLLPLLLTSSFNLSAYAVDMETAKTEDPAKAEETLTSKDQSKKSSFEERRKELKAKHKKKKEDKVAAKKIVKAKSASSDNSQAIDGIKEMKRESHIQEHKDERAPKN